MNANVWLAVIGHMVSVLFDLLVALQSSFYVNHRFVTDSNILASNGIIHVLQGPLKAPPPPTEVSDVAKRLAFSSVAV